VRGRTTRPQQPRLQHRQVSLCTPNPWRCAKAGEPAHLDACPGSAKNTKVLCVNLSNKASPFRMQQLRIHQDSWWWIPVCNNPA
jgi:hypothetical protein